MKTRPSMHLALLAIATTPILLFRRACAHERHEWLSPLVAAPALTAGLVAVVVAIWPDWIEAFRVVPDGGGGSLEWGVSILPVAVGLVLRVLVRKDWRIDAANPIENLTQGTP